MMVKEGKRKDLVMARESGVRLKTGDEEIEKENGCLIIEQVG